MKKHLILLLVFILAFCSACAVVPSDTVDALPMPSAEPPTDTPTEMPTTIPAAPMLCDSPPPSGEVFVPWDSIEGLPQVAYDLKVYSSLDELCGEAAYIFVGTVADIEVENLEEKDWDTPEPVYATKVWYRLDIAQSIKGDIAADGASVYQTGHRYGDINFCHEYFPPMCFGETYLIFAYDTTLVCTPFVGFNKIKGGKLIPSENTDLFADGQPVDDVIQEIGRIEAAQAAPEEISITGGTQSLMQAIAAEPDFTPVRDLTKNELDLMYHFNNDALLEDYQGKELTGGDIIIWLKTVRLTDQQMQIYESSNGSATKTSSLNPTHPIATIRLVPRGTIL